MRDLKKNKTKNKSNFQYQLIYHTTNNVRKNSVKKNKQFSYLKIVLFGRILFFIL